MGLKLPILDPILVGFSVGDWGAIGLSTEYLVFDGIIRIILRNLKKSKKKSLNHAMLILQLKLAYLTKSR